MKKVKNGKIIRAFRPKFSVKKKYHFPIQIKKQRKTVSVQSQNELEPIISTPINGPMSDE